MDVSCVLLKGSGECQRRGEIGRHFEFGGKIKINHVGSHAQERFRPAHVQHSLSGDQSRFLPMQANVLKRESLGRHTGIYSHFPERLFVRRRPTTGKMKAPSELLRALPRLEFSAQLEYFHIGYRTGRRCDEIHFQKGPTKSSRHVSLNNTQFRDHIVKAYGQMRIFPVNRSADCLDLKRLFFQVAIGEIIDCEAVNLGAEKFN